MKKSILFIGLAVILGVFVSAKSFAQGTQQIPKYGKDSIKTLTKMSLYQEFYNQWEKEGYSNNNSLKDALTSWRWVFENAPRASENVYIHGAKMYRYKIQKADDKKRKAGLVDTLMQIYDQRLTYFPTGSNGQSQEGKILGYKGVDLYQFMPGKVDEVFEILDKSVALRGTKSQSAVLVYYFRTAIQRYENGTAQKSLIVETYDKVSTIIDKNLKKYADNKRYLAIWENVQANIENSFEPYATCEDLTGIYRQKFEENPEDTDLLKKITSILDKKDCAKTDLFFETTKKLHELEPTAESAKKMGRMLLEEKNYDDAIQYLKQSSALFEDEVAKAEDYKMLSNIYSIKKQWKVARSYAYKALEYIPKDGSLYIMIGDMYASTAKQCGDNELSSKAAYWAAVDKYQKAKQIDPTVADEANQRINTYKQYFPRKETIFFHDYSEGDTYEVECWINETTTVRASN